MSKVRTDIGPFAITPLWLIERVSPRALQVWCLLNAKWADRDTGECFPSRATISELLGISEDTVDRAVKELTDVGSLEIEERFRDDGRQSSNLYRIVTVDRGGRMDAEGGPQECGAGGRMDAEPGAAPMRYEQESVNQNQGTISLSSPSALREGLVEDEGDKQSDTPTPDGHPVVSDSTIDPEIALAASMITETWGRTAARELGLLDGKRPAWTGRLDAAGIVECVRLAVLVSDLIKEAGNTRVPNPFTVRACSPVRMMLEKDGHSPKKIEVLARWALNDSFWCANILSTQKLREKWDQLRNRRNDDIAKNRQLAERERGAQVAEVGEDWMARTG